MLSEFPSPAVFLPGSAIALLLFRRLTLNKGVRQCEMEMESVHRLGCEMECVYTD